MNEIDLEVVHEGFGMVYLEPVSRHSIYAMDRKRGFIWFPGGNGIPDGCELEAREL